MGIKLSIGTWAYMFGKYADNPNYGHYVSVIMTEAGRQWVTRVIELLQEGYEGTRVDAEPSEEGEEVNLGD